MKIASFSVQNFRSIIEARKLPIAENMTVLVGPNNEGKSNIIRALVMAMEILDNGRRVHLRQKSGPPKVIESFSARDYKYDRDFPLALQHSSSDKRTVFVLEFDLDESELEELRNEIKSQLKSPVPLRIEIDSTGHCEITVSKRGPGQAKLSSKNAQIARFLSARIKCEYIKAVRTADSARKVVNDLLEAELAGIEEEVAFKDALDQISALQAPILERVSSNIQSTLREFLPKISAVKITIPEEARYRALRRSCEIMVDDGTETELNRKGDGVQSLAALGIMRHMSEGAAGGRSLLVAIEEPESHLHPYAIRDLNRVLQELAEVHQLIITTHCPLFINRRDISTNIIVRDRKASPVNSISEIREVLGVQISDNLLSASTVLVVEGRHDAKMIHKLLSETSDNLSKAIDTNILAIDSLQGAGNLPYKLSLLRGQLCDYHVFLDADGEGRSQVEKAVSDGYLRESEYQLTTVRGLKDSEFEDLVNLDIYKSEIEKQFAVKLEWPKDVAKKAWSVMMSSAFTTSGKVWSKPIEAQVKAVVAEAVCRTGMASVVPAHRGCLDALVESLEDRLK